MASELPSRQVLVVDLIEAGKILQVQRSYQNPLRLEKARTSLKNHWPNQARTVKSEWGVHNIGASLFQNELFVMPIKPSLEPWVMIMSHGNVSSKSPAEPPMSDPFNGSKAPLLSASKIMKSVIMSCFSHQKSSVLAEHEPEMKLVRCRFLLLVRHVSFTVAVLNLRLVGMGRNSC